MCTFVKVKGPLQVFHDTLEKTKLLHLAYGEVCLTCLQLATLVLDCKGARTLTLPNLETECPKLKELYIGYSNGLIERSSLLDSFPLLASLNISDMTINQWKKSRPRAPSCSKGFDVSHEFAKQTCYVDTKFT